MSCGVMDDAVAQLLVIYLVHLGSEKKNSIVFYSFTKHLLTIHLDILHIFLATDRVCTAPGPKTPWSLKSQHINTETGNLSFSMLRSIKVEQFDEMYKTRQAGPFGAI